MPNTISVKFDRKSTPGDNKVIRKKVTRMQPSRLFRILPVMAFLFFTLCDPHPMSAAQTPTDASSLPLPDTLPAHPRLILTPSVKERVAQLIKTDPLAKRFFDRIQQGAKLVEQTPVITRQLDGDKRKRMLKTSRLVLNNIVSMGVAHTFSPDAELRDRMIAEMIAVAAFEDWYPQHFLDTSEMTLAMALGYDWLYDELTEDQRETIRQGITKHGLQAALTNHGGLNWHNNWNQVRHGSLTAGALAVYEHQPELAGKILQQAKDHFPIALHAYEGDGVYPEGPMYWDYGTSFSWVMSACLTSALGDDWGILQSPGFAQSFEYVKQVTTPTGLLFNYADCVRGPLSQSLHIWAGAMLNRPDYIHMGMQSLEPYFRHIKATGPRLTPLAILWYQPVEDNQHLTHRTCYVGQSDHVQIAAIRSRWDDPKASFIGIKGGDIQINHGHMDIGSFIVEADGQRWAEDLGMEKEIYDRKDSWGTDQDASRWIYLRANNFGHNTLTLGGKLQQVIGNNPILRHGQTEDMQFAILDMSTAYKAQAQQIHRGIALLTDQSMIVQDDLQGIDEQLDLRWSMFTTADIQLADDKRSATLTLKGQTMQMAIQSPDNATFVITDATPPTKAENPNKDYQRLLITCPAPVSDGSLMIHFIPGSLSSSSVPMLHSLADWQ